MKIECGFIFGIFINIVMRNDKVFFNKCVSEFKYFILSEFL